MNVGAILLLILSGLLLIALHILHRKKGPHPKIRPLPAFKDLRAETGYAAESGGAVHIALGNGGLSGEGAAQSLAGLQVVKALADTAISYGAPPIITVGDPTLLILAQDIVRRAYERAGAAESYDPSLVRFVAPSPVAYAAGAAYAVASENVTASMLAGTFGTEASLITDAGTRRDLPQLAAAADPRALAALYPATDRLAVGEELFAAGAQMTGDRRYLIGLLAQDVLRIILVLAILVAAGLAFLSSGRGG